MSEKDKANLLAILDAYHKIRRFVANISDADTFYADEKTFDAVLMNFVIIGEAVAKLSDTIRTQENHIPWTKIKGLRNIVAHNYFGVDAEEIWQIIHNNMPHLVQDIQDILDNNT